MGQRLLSFDSTPEALFDLTDVNIDDVQDWDTIVRLGNFWVNKNINDVFLSAFSLKASVYEDNFTALTNSINIVNTNDRLVNVNLPQNPEIGDRLMFIDFNSNSPQNQNLTGWGLNKVTLLAPFNTFIEGRPFAELDDDRGAYHFMFMPGNNWVNILRSPKEIIKTVAQNAYTLLGIDQATLIIYTGVAGTLTLDITPLEDAVGNYFKFMNLSSQQVNLTAGKTVRYSNNTNTLLSVQYRESKILNIGSDWIVT